MTETQDTTMASYYQIINGTPYKRAVLTHAYKLTEDKTKVLTVKGAHELLVMVQDGGKVTAHEKDTLQYVAKEFPCDKAAVKILCGEGSYYLTKDGVHYDRELYELIEAFSDMGKIGKNEAHRIWKDAQDGRGVTKHEADTIRFHKEKYDEDALKFLERELKKAGY